MCYGEKYRRQVRIFLNDEFCIVFVMSGYVVGNNLMNFRKLPIYIQGRIFELN